ncbi:hypothetical protein CBOM_02613 [Ceraceosorus bombacis]|uniref:WD40/YVTN repeat-like-containing domain n=1 Tax=Ceraceosorus bombacis TaxID=401625 RepID=A0A0P1BF28_9BASI|nr:hypothetical protein CBOM_02613 [Ceraceosorus bombacis]
MAFQSDGINRQFVPTGRSNILDLAVVSDTCNIIRVRPHRAITTTYQWSEDARRSRISSAHIPVVDATAFGLYGGYAVVSREGPGSSVQLWREARHTYEKVGDLDLAIHLETPCSIRLRFPTCVGVSKNRQFAHVHRLYKFTTWNALTRETRSTHRIPKALERILDVDFAAEKGIIFVVSTKGSLVLSNDAEILLDMICHPWRFIDIDLRSAPSLLDGCALRSSQIYVATAFIADQSPGIRHTPVTVRWRSAEEACFQPAYSARNSLFSYLTQYLGPASGDVQEPLGVYVDIATDTLVQPFCWGLMLLRPYSEVRPEGNHELLRIGILHYHMPPPAKSSFVNHKSMSMSDSRVLQAMTQSPAKHHDHTHLLIVDLKAHRLDPAWRPEKHVFEDVKVWHLENSRGGEVEGDELVDTCIDATTVYTSRKLSPVQYIDFDFGVAAKNCK